MTAAVAATTETPTPIWSPLGLRPGQVAALVGEPGSGMTRIGLSLIADHAGVASRSVACLDVRGWLSPLAAWEVGIAPEHLILVRCSDAERWGRAAAALLGGVSAVYAEVPAGVDDGSLRRLGALARKSRTALVLRRLRGDLPSGIAGLRLEASQVWWEGPDAGHGRLIRRRLLLTATGKVVHGMRRAVEVEDDGTNALRVVSGLAAAEA